MALTEVIRRHASLEIRSRVPAGLRVLCGIVAIIPLIAPWELLIEPAWKSFMHPAFFFALLISAGALAVSALFLMAAVAGLNTVMTFDTSKRMVSTAQSAPLVPFRTIRYQFSRIRELNLEREEVSEGDPSYALVVLTDDGKRLRSPSSTDAAVMEESLRQARSLIEQGRVQGPPLR